MVHFDESIKGIIALIASHGAHDNEQQQDPQAMRLSASFMWFRELFKRFNKIAHTSIYMKISGTVCFFSQDIETALRSASSTFSNKSLPLPKSGRSAVKP